jgi:hypothetical protein
MGGSARKHEAPAVAPTILAVAETGMGMVQALGGALSSGVDGSGRLFCSGPVASSQVWRTSRGVR